MPAGRPSKYEERFCDEVIEDAKLGFSLTAFAGKIGVDRDTILEWSRVHPEFSVAVRRHKAIRARTLEEGLLKADATGPNVTSRIFALKNAAPEDWKEVARAELTGRDGAAIQTETTLNFGGLSESTLRELAASKIEE